MSNDLVCKECNKGTIARDYEKGHWVCTACGMILDQVVEQGPEWTAYNASETASRARTGGVVTATKVDMGLSTRINYSRYDGKGRKLNSATMEKMRKLRQIEARENRPRERNLKEALAELKRLTAQLGLSKIIAETSSQYYRKALDKKLIRGRSITSMMAAAVYAGARTHNRPLSLKNLATMSKASKKEIARCYRVYVMELNIKPKGTSISNVISNLCGVLKLSMRTQRQALFILEEAKKYKINVGKNPISMAAAGIYIAAMQTGEKRTQQDVAKAANTTPVTLRTRYREIVKALEIQGISVKRGGAAAPIFFTPPQGRDY